MTKQDHPTVTHPLDRWVERAGADLATVLVLLGAGTILAYVIDEMPGTIMAMTVLAAVAFSVRRAELWRR